MSPNLWRIHPFKLQPSLRCCGHFHHVIGFSDSCWGMQDDRSPTEKEPHWAFFLIVCCISSPEYHIQLPYTKAYKSDSISANCQFKFSEFKFQFSSTVGCSFTNINSIFNEIWNWAGWYSSNTLDLNLVEANLNLSHITGYPHKRLLRLSISLSTQMSSKYFQTGHRCLLTNLYLLIISINTTESL